MEVKKPNSLFGKWYSWCVRRNLDPFSGPVTEVVNFLEEGYHYNSALFHQNMTKYLDGYNVGQHPLITRLLKGFFNVRLPFQNILVHGMYKWY